MGDFDYRKLDDLIHSRVRLAIMAYLASAGEAGFAAMKTALKVTDGNLSVHLKKLEDAGYVAVDKRFVDRKPLTTAALTPEGRAAFEAYVKGLSGFISDG